MRSKRSLEENRSKFLKILKKVLRLKIIFWAPKTLSKRNLNHCFLSHKTWANRSATYFQVKSLSCLTKTTPWLEETSSRLRPAALPKALCHLTRMPQIPTLSTLTSSNTSRWWTIWGICSSFSRFSRFKTSLMDSEPCSSSMSLISKLWLQEMHKAYSKMKLKW